MNIDIKKFTSLLPAVFLCACGEQTQTPNVDDNDEDIKVEFVTADEMQNRLMKEFNTIPEDQKYFYFADTGFDKEIAQAVNNEVSSQLKNGEQRGTKSGKLLLETSIEQFRKAYNYGYIKRLKILEDNISEAFRVIDNAKYTIFESLKISGISQSKSMARRQIERIEDNRKHSNNRIAYETFNNVYFSFTACDDSTNMSKCLKGSITNESPYKIINMRFDGTYGGIGYIRVDLEPNYISNVNKFSFRGQVSPQNLYIHTMDILVNGKLTAITNPLNTKKKTIAESLGYNRFYASIEPEITELHEKKQEREIIEHLMMQNILSMKNELKGIQ